MKTVETGARAAEATPAGGLPDEAGPAGGPHSDPRRPTRRPWIALAVILIAAAGLRFTALDTLPPGLFHDEALYAFDAREVLRTDYRPIYFERNTGGREPLFIYLLAGLMALLGETELTLRLLAATVGTLTVLVTFFLGWRLFSTTVGLLAAGLLAVLPWHVHVSRDGFRAILLPLLVALAWWLLERARQRGRLVDGLAAGLATGLVFYTYMAGRIFWVAVLLWLGYLLLTRSRRTPWRAMALALAVAALVMAPLGVYYWTHPDIFLARLGQVAPGEALTVPAGGLRDSALKVLGMFSLAGDANWRHNVAGRPVFDPLVSALFYAGILLCLIGLLRRRAPAAALLLIWTGVMLLPSALTDDAPHFLRAIGALPAIVFFPALAVDYLLNRLAGRRRRLGYTAAGVGLAVLCGVTAHTYFGTFARSVEAYDAYGAAFEAACREAADVPPDEQVLFSSSLYRHATCRFLAPGEPAFRWFDGTEALVLPHPTGRTAHYLAPEGELDPAFAQVLAVAERFSGPLGPRGPAFTRFRLDTDAYRQMREALAPQYPLAARFADRLAVRGYSLELSPDTAVVYVYWEALRPSEFGPDNTTAFSLRLADRSGEVWAQRDGLGYLDPEWQPGDQVISRFPLHLPDDAPPGAYHPEVVVYQRRTKQPAPVAGPPDGPPDRLILPEFTWPGGRVADPATLPKPTNPIDQVVRPGLRLRGLDLPPSVRAGEGLPTTWHWLAEAAPAPMSEEPVTISLQSIDQPDQPPVLWTVPPVPDAPASRWQPGQALRARHRLPVPADLEPGAYRLAIAALPDGAARPVGTITVEGRPRRFDLPALDHPVAEEFPGLGTLAGYSVEPSPARTGQPVAVTLLWQATGSTAQALTAFVHLLDADGRVVAQHDGPPDGGAAPTTSWLPGEVIQDRHTIALPADLPPGAYRLEIGLYDPLTGERRKTRTGAAEVVPGALEVEPAT